MWTSPPDFKYAGTVSSGTHRAADLIPAFIPVLRELDPDSAQRIERDYPAVIANPSREWDDLAELCMVEIFDALQLAAPEGYVFSAHEGDGADFGFWVSNPHPWEVGA